MDSDNRELVVQIQRFTASSISMLNLLRNACLRSSNVGLSERDIRSKDRFLKSTFEFIEQMKDPNNDFDFTRFIRKAFTTLKLQQHCEYLINKDKCLFEVRDNNNKIMTILPGIDLKIGYALLEDNKEDEKKAPIKPDAKSTTKPADKPTSELVLFWQYMYLFSSSVFNLIKTSNESAFEKKYAHVTDTLNALETDISKTGVMFNDQIFNPFIGVDGCDRPCSVDDMFTGGELPKQCNVSIDTVLSTLGVDKMFDEKKLQEELQNFTEENANEATDKIVGLLGASNNTEVREVCNTLIKDIVYNFKENGVANIGDTLKQVATNAKMTIDPSKMKQTASSMQHFIANGQETMKDMKDANGNPIGQQLMNSMAVPLNMMNMMNISKPAQ